MSDNHDAIRYCDRLLSAGRYEEAYRAAHPHWLADNTDTGALAAFGAAAMLTRRLEEANACLAAQGALDDKAARPVLIYWLRLLVGTARFDLAETVSELFLARHPGEAAAHFRHAEILLRRQKFAEALSAFEAAKGLAPQGDYRLADLESRLLLIGGDRAGALKAARKAVALSPRAIQAHVLIVDITDGDIAAVPEFDLAALAGLRDDPRLSPADKAQIGYCLGRIAEAGGDADNAFLHYENANAQLTSFFARQGGGYNESEADQSAHMIAEIFDPAFVAEPGFKQSIRRPIFVVGLPRSGTSLLERILSAHSEVESIGEHDLMPALLRRVLREAETGGAEAARRLIVEQAADMTGAYLADTAPGRFVDKTPQNLLAIGLIRCLFPAAAIIHARRNPMATALSIYAQPLSQAFPYAVDLQWIGHYWQLSERLARKWQALGGDAILEVSYKELVSHPDSEIRRILRHCDLEPEAACFAPESAEGPAFTRSAAAVREKIHTRAVDRWRSFEGHLGPFRAAAGLDPNESE